MPVNTGVLALILGGGQGTRLFPLTQHRSKPAVPIGGKYRLIDIPVSNCLHADIRRIFVLTQFNSASLNRHISQTYRMDLFSPGFVEILAAEQTPDNPNWYQGTADAVRQAARHFARYEADYYLILAGDHLYRMNYTELIDAHVDRHADITIATQPVTIDDASSMGIVRFDRNGQIMLTRPGAPFRFYDPRCPIYTHPRFLPGARLGDCTARDAIIAEGCYFERSTVEESIVGIRTNVQSGAIIRRSVLLGADFYESDDDAPARDASPRLGIGRDVELHRVIVDKNARIGDGSRLVNEAGVETADGDGYFIRNGVIIVPKDGIIKPGTTI